MSLTLYAHPFSSYCQKVLIALYVNDLPFTYKHLETSGVAVERAALWPFGKFPMLVEDGKVVADQHHHRTSGAASSRSRRADSRRSDCGAEGPLSGSHVRHLRHERHAGTRGRDSAGGRGSPRGDSGSGCAALDVAYAWLDDAVEDGPWAAGDQFSLVDCAAAPALFYADWVHEIGAAFPRLRAYRSRLLGRPSVARCIEEGRPYRAYFPLGVPDRN